jgi:hypothetical protein
MSTYDGARALSRDYCSARRAGGGRGGQAADGNPVPPPAPAPAVRPARTGVPSRLVIPARQGYRPWTTRSSRDRNPTHRAGRQRRQRNALCPDPGPGPGRRPRRADPPHRLRRRADRARPRIRRHRRRSGRPGPRRPPRRRLRRAALQRLLAPRGHGRLPLLQGHPGGHRQRRGHEPIHRAAD